LSKKIISILTISIILFIILSGCLNKSESTENSDISNNLPPIAKIIAPNKAYFGENIEFDASNSFDLDGKIVLYSWNFGDGENVEGIKVSHSYELENNYFIEYPLIYPVILLIKDNKGTLIATTHQIKVYPGEYKFYLNFNGLIAEKPIFFEDKINSFIYNLEEPICLNKCIWSLTLYLEKPLFAPINKITITLYSSIGEKIIIKQQKFGIIKFWKEKNIKLSGEINKEIEFKSLKIEIHSFSFKPKINIVYGGEKASFISFDFMNL